MYKGACVQGRMEEVLRGDARMYVFECGDGWEGVWERDGEG